MSSTTLKKQYDEKIVPALTKEFNYTTPMQVPRLTKIVINEVGSAKQPRIRRLSKPPSTSLPPSQARRLLLPFRRRTSPTSRCVRKCLSVRV